MNFEGRKDAWGNYEISRSPDHRIRKYNCDKYYIRQDIFACVQWTANQAGLLHPNFSKGNYFQNTDSRCIAEEQPS